MVPGSVDGIRGPMLTLTGGGIPIPNTGSRQTSGCDLASGHPNRIRRHDHKERPIFLKRRVALPLPFPEVPCHTGVPAGGSHGLSCRPEVLGIMKFRVSLV